MLRAVAGLLVRLGRYRDAAVLEGAIRATGAGHRIFGADLVSRVYSMKWRAVEAAKRVVDIALDVVGGGAMHRSNELERLYRDVRCGGFHPGNDALTHELVGKSVLGILAEQPRW